MILILQTLVVMRWNEENASGRKPDDDVEMVATNDDDFLNSTHLHATQRKKMTRLGAEMLLHGSLNTCPCCAS
jgi:hypothetical protein